MKNFYLILLSLVLTGTTTSVLGQAIQLDDNHSLFGFPFNGKLFLRSERDSTLWQSNGTAAGTNQFSAVKSDDSFEAMNNKIYFAGFNAANGAELWETDGSALGTVLVSDIWAGPDSSKPGNFTVFNNKLYFTAFTPSLGRELYEYSGSGSPVSKTDLNTGSGSSFGQPQFYELNSVLYFNAMNNTGNAIYGMQTSGTITKILDLPVGYSLNIYEHIGNKIGRAHV